MTARRFIFVLTETSGSSGGIAVLYDCAETLAKSGFDTAILHSSPTGAYKNTPFNPKVLYSFDLRRTARHRTRWIRRVVRGVQLFAESLQGGPNEEWHPSDSDILVVPDYLVADVQETYGPFDKIVFVQNSFSYARACSQAMARGLDPHAGVLRSIGISRTCLDMLEIAGAAPCSYVPVTPDLPRFAFADQKARKIAYMPRKRLEEASLLVPALARRANISDFELVEIERMSQQQVADTMRDSLIFISLLRDEALGFPAMEAMSAGCITIGYTGLGTAEYFNEETGVPVADGDTAALIDAIERTIAEYDSDSARLDAMRRTASERVNKTYSRANFETALLDAWDALNLK